jgi:putative acetyltransferase
MIELRPARDEDALGVIELIGSVFGEYPHCVMDVDGEMPELRRIASYMSEARGEFWVSESGGRIVGMGGYTASSTNGDTSGIELRKLYVHRSMRKTGLGGRIVDRIEEAARARRAPFIDLWSDTRFTTAHAFYERRGWARGGTRELHDLSKTIEFYFKKTLTP